MGWGRYDDVGLGHRRERWGAINRLEVTRHLNANEISRVLVTYMVSAVSLDSILFE